MIASTAGRGCVLAHALYVNEHLQYVLTFSGMYSLIVFYSSHRVRSTFMFVICLGGAQFPIPHPIFLSLAAASFMGQL